MTLTKVVQVDPHRRSAPRAHRYTVRVPVADTSVSEWWSAQADSSASVRALIRDEIMRHGFTDTVNRPVTQLPRRGRPPLSAREENLQNLQGEDARVADQQTEVQPSGTASEKSEFSDTPYIGNVGDSAGSRLELSDISDENVDGTGVNPPQFDIGNIFDHA